MKTQMEKNLEEAFGLPEDEKTLAELLPTIELEAVSEVGDNPEVDKDFEYVRTNLKELLQTNKQAIDLLMTLARTTEKPGMFEVLSALINSMISANKEIIGSWRTLKQVKSQGRLDGKFGKSQGVTLDGKPVVFSGTTKELVEKKDR